MGYRETKDYINSLNTRGIVPGLDNEIILLEKLGNPHHNLNFIHIAGTNGKGSVGAYLSEILCAYGKSVARFVSPCVGNYENTFLFNCKPVCEEVITNATELVKNAMDELETIGIFPTSFETEVALSFVVFNLMSPDYVLLECGMGGKNDATNVIPTPTLAVITKISMDHTAYLGNSLKEIATEKSGIIKKGTQVVTLMQENEAMSPIISKCTYESVPLHIADKPENISYGDCETSFTVNTRQYLTKMLGTFQPQNASVAIKCAEVLGIDYNSINRGIINANWKYRFEKIGKFILDGAHNPDGAMELAKSIEKYFSGKKIAFICGCFKDKEYEKITEITSHYANKVFCIKAPTTRGLNPEILCDAFLRNGADATVSPLLKDAINEANKYENVIIFGTLSILHDAKEIIEGIK